MSIRLEIDESVNNFSSLSNVDKTIFARAITVYCGHSVRVYCQDQQYDGTLTQFSLGNAPDYLNGNVRIESTNRGPNSVKTVSDIPIPLITGIYNHED